MTPHENSSISDTRQWVLLPLRLFLGITFVYAGIQKLTDPQFFHPSTAGYIGNQLASFANGSPLRALLLQIGEPHAIFFGLLIAYGEVAIGFGTLFGILFRPATFFGMILNLLFYLTATWRVYPYFYGSDVVFVFCWLTLMLNGPIHTGLPTFDELFASPNQQGQCVRIRQILLGIAPSFQLAALPIEKSQPTANQVHATTEEQEREVKAHIVKDAQSGRRNVLRLLGSGFATLGMAALFYTLFTPHQKASSTTASVTQSASGTGPANATPSTASTVIAHAEAVPMNSSLSFTIPSTGDPGVLIHLNNDQFVAYDALCTHAGCPVGYDSSSKLLECPCHGAMFDPAKNAIPVQPPANTALTPVAIHVDSATGAITLADS